jgi:hypothetical protein
MDEHYEVLCRNCGAVVEQCKCSGPKVTSYVSTCSQCKKPPLVNSVQWTPIPSVYSYDRRAAEAPANILKNTGRALHTVEHELGRTEASLKGLLNQLTLMSRSTHDKNVQANFKTVHDLKEQFEKFHKEARNLAELFDNESRKYR